jgi:hypothetical protein
MHSESITGALGSGVPTPMQLLQQQSRTGSVTITVPTLDEDNVFSRVRCPLCGWRPSSSSRWCCRPFETPEPFFAGCGTIWNTFSTRGQCPGCNHQWRWTSCLSCHGWSRHEDWYEEETSRG